MIEDELQKVQNLLERKRNYEICIKNLKPYQGEKVITNIKTGENERITARIFASICRFETQTGPTAHGYIDEKAEKLLLPIFEKLLVEVQQEIDAISINGVPGKEAEIKTMYSEEIQPMFRENHNKPKESESPKWVKWVIPIVIGFVLLLLLNLFG